jgi:hypothetical protein
MWISITNAILETEDSATEWQDIEGEAENGNPIIVHELGKYQRFTKCIWPRFLSSFMMSLHCKSLNKLPLMYWSYIHTTGAVHKMEEIAKICKGIPIATMSWFWFRKETKVKRWFSTPAPKTPRSASSIGCQVPWDQNQSRSQHTDR